MSVVANVAINVDSRDATTKLRQVQSQSQATERAVNGLGAAVGKLAAAFSAIQAAKFVFVQTAELEKQTRSLEVLTGSATKAAQIIKELKDIGAVTPFTSTELIDSAKRLQAFGVETNKVVETTRRLADVSGATGAELQGLVTAYGQVQAKGKLQGEELLQFQERGVALQQVLREEYKLSGEEFQDALSKGRISAEAVEFAIQKLTDAGGKYANGAVAQSDTLAGRLSTLQDAVQNLAQRLGTILAPAMQSILGLAIDIANQINNVFETILLQRQLGANLAPAMRDQLFKQAGQEALEIAKLRGGRNAGQFGRSGAMIRSEEFQRLREERFRDLMRTYGYEQGILTPPTAAPPTAAATLPGLMAPTGKGKGAKGKSDAERAAEKAAREEAQLQSRLRGLQIETQGTLQLALIKGKIAEAEMAGNKELAIRLQGEQRNQQIILDLQRSLEGVTDERERQALQVKALADLEAAGMDTAAEMERLMQDRAKSIQDVISGLEFEQVKMLAVTDAQKQAIQFIQIENQLKSQGITLSNEQVAAIRRIIAENDKLSKQQEAAKKQAEFIKAQYETIGTSIGDQLVGVFDNLIKKTKDWNDVLSDALMSIGKVLMMAGLNMLAGSDGIGVLSFLGFGTRANGGPVSSNTPYIVGERGPELFVPSSSGSVMSNADTRAALAEQSAARSTNDTRAMLEQQTAARQANATGMALQQKPIDVRYESSVINNVEYVTADQHRKGLAQAAERGRALTLAALQNSTRTRKKVGI